MFKGQYVAPGQTVGIDVAIKTVKECEMQQYNMLAQEIRIMSYIHSEQTYSEQHINIVALVGAVTKHLNKGWCIHLTSAYLKAHYAWLWKCATWVHSITI